MPAAQFSLSFDSTLGPVRILGTERGIGDVRFAKKITEDSVDAPVFFGDCREQVKEYLAGGRRMFTDLPLCIRGTAFQQDVWKRAMEIPFGTTTTYGELAKDLDGTAAQAIGQALKKNPLALIIPCHRIVPTKSIGGYAWGVWRKKWLLTHEKHCVSV